MCAHKLSALVVGRVVLLALLLWPRAASAQLIDLLDLRSEYLPPTELRGARPAGHTPWSQADNAQVSTYSAALNLPLALSKSTLLVPGFSYRIDSISFSHESPNERELGLHSLQVPLTWVQLLSSKWMLLAQVSPGLAGDLDALDNRALRVSGLAVAAYQLSEQLTLGGGGAAMLEFGSLLPVPLLYAQWEPLSYVTVSSLFPAMVDAKVTFGDRFEAGVHADVDGNSYAISDSAIAKAWPCADGTDDPTTTDNEAQADADRCIDHVAYSVATAGARLGARLFASVWLTLYVGHTFFRRFEQMNQDDARVAGGMQTLPNVFFARLGLTWRLPDGDDQGTQPAQSSGDDQGAPPAQPRGSAHSTGEAR